MLPSGALMNSLLRFQSKFLVSVLLLSLFSGCGKKTSNAGILQASIDVQAVEVKQSVELQTIYGTFKIEDPVIIDLLASNAMQRLKKINQHGINDVIKPEYAFSRYDHSVGVFILTRMFGGSLEEQVAALLHDVSHTVFSHVGDLVFAAPAEVEADHAYQDDIHEWFVEQTDLAPILRTYGMRHVVSDEAKLTFKRLEQDYPDICTDRLDYQLRTAYIAGMLTLEEVHDILQHLHFENDRWFFDAVEPAHNFGIASELLTRYIYASAYNHYLYKFAADAFKRALEIGIVTAKELHFSTDEIIWDRILSNDDAYLQEILYKIYNYKTAYVESDASDYDYFKKSKCRVVDPLVSVAGELVRLTEVDSEFAHIYHDIQRFCNDGVYLKFKEIEG